MRLVVQKFGMQIFNDGLRQTLRLPYQEFEDTSSGEILSILQKVRTDTERFITNFINILFSSVVRYWFPDLVCFYQTLGVDPCFSDRSGAARRIDKSAKPVHQSIATFTDPSNRQDERDHH